jgi:exodeoxyribonuclease V gamma subunit
VIDLSYSNRTEPLLDALAENVASTQATLYDPVTLLVPNHFVESYVKQGLARRRGIAANVQARFLRGFLRDVAVASAPGLRVIDRDVIEGELLALFHDGRRLAPADFGAVRSYLGAEDGDRDARDAIDRRRAQLAAKMAELFDEYAYSRPDMLAAWRKGALIAGWDEPLQTWQRALWLALFGRTGGLSSDASATLPDFFARTPPSVLRVPGPVHVFGISFVARLYRSIFASLARATSLFVYTLNPCRELWEDLQPARRAGPKPRAATSTRASRQLALALDDAPPAAAPVDENPLLALWGRPGRDSIRLYNELSNCDFHARFEDPAADPAAPTLLATLQRELLDRAPRSRAPAPHDDDSVVIFAAPDPRRELEAVAAEIWSLVRRDETLRFDDFAVVVPTASAATYLPLAREVFTSASDLPHTVLDLPSPAEGHVREAVEMMLALPLGPLGRRDLLPLAMHPTVARRFPDVDPEMFLALCEELGVVRGADAGDLGDSYADDDRVSWDQGLRRLALGAFLSGPRSGERRPFSADGGGDVLAAELSAGAEGAARALGIIARELIAFARSARAMIAPIPAFMELLRRALTATIRPEGDEEQAVLRDCFGILERVAETAPPDLDVGFAVAAELVKARLGAARPRRRGPEGVTVATLAPLRALSFRTVFVVGLDERVFPSAQGFSALDLRGAAPQPGDVTPREQDEYLFLETLQSARERLRLSYVGRDAVTGERKDPSSTLLAFCDALASGADGERLVGEITRKSPPLARHEDGEACDVVPAAARERRAVGLGRSLRQAAQVIQLPDTLALDAALAPAAWEAIRAPLGRIPLAAKPDAGRAVTTLTLANLRRFLECPLQGSARVLLPMRDDDDAEDDAEAALRERENLGDARMQTLPLLRELFGRAIDAGATDDAALAERYDAAIAGLRLDGTLPSGLFGKVLRQRHIETLKSWREGLRQALEGRLPNGLAPIWYGAAPEHRPDIQLSPALTLSVQLPDGPRAVSLIGQSEPLSSADGEGLAVTLVMARPRGDDQHRDRLRAWLTHLARAASGAGAGRKLVSLALGANRDGAAEVKSAEFAPLAQADALARLADLAGDLLSGVHPYLMPCEGIFTWKRRENTDREMTIRQAIMLVRDDGWTRLSSDRGPVADARRYPVPDDADLEARVRRRFHPYFDSLRVPG